MSVASAAALAVKARLEAIGDVFDDADIERGLRLLTQGERDRLAKLIRRADS